MRASIVSAALFLASVNAIQILTPTKDEVVDLNDFSYKVTWSTVSTDPTSAHLFLVNQAGGHTPYSKDLGAIDLTKGSYTVAAFTIAPDDDFQFNIQSVDPLNTGILAQSQQFEIVKSNSTSSTSTLITSTTSGPASSATTGSGSGSSPDISTVSAPSSTATGSTSSNSTSTSTGAPTTKTSGANANKVVSGSFLALALGAFAVVA